MNGLSLFANVGIAETYLKQEGIDIVVANELLPERARFYQHLYPDCNMICGDITSKETYNQIIAAAKEKNVEFIIATPPCQGMSYAGHKDPNDIRNSLIAYVFDAIRDLSPKYVLIENVVPQLKTPVTYEGRTLLIPDMVEFLFGPNYTINKNHVLSVETLGVPQNRKRALFLLVDKSLGKTWEIPKGDGSVVTLLDAIGDLPSLDPPIKEKGLTEKIFPEYEDKKQKGLAVSKWHVARQHVWRNVEVMMHTPTGKSAKDNPVYYPKNKDGKMVGGSCCAYKRMDWDKPAPTVTTYNHTISSFHNVHPGRLDPKTGLYSDARVLTVFELMRVTSLPDDWNIPDWASENLIRQVIGEGIPPLAIKKVVAELAIPREESK
jgi:DNA (cytosine-5)-methyltransferase 1